jgi:lipoprotein-anchoring transpeptidase ErfK/SrfK
MKGLFGCALAFLTLLVPGPVVAQQSQPPKAPMSLAKAPLSSVGKLERPASSETAVSEPVEVPSPLSVAAAVADEVAPAPPPVPITLVLKADLKSQHLIVEEDGEARYVWPISSGRAGYATKTGTFRPQWTSRMHYSRQYDLSPMPHAVFFNKGAAFHATREVRYLGRPASHGCIRLAPGNAAHLYRLVHQHGFYRTKVIVHRGAEETPVAAGADAAKPRSASRRKLAEAGERKRRSRYNRYGGGSFWSWSF